MYKAFARVPAGFIGVLRVDSMCPDLPGDEGVSVF